MPKRSAHKQKDTRKLNEVESKRVTFVAPDDDSAVACIICDKEYTARKMGEGNPYEGLPVCTRCLPKALNKEKATKLAEENAGAQSKWQEET